jgi:hypothetical protein
MGWAAEQSSVGIMSDSPVADEDLTIDLKTGVADPNDGCFDGRLTLPEMDDVTRGLGVLGWTETLGVTGKLLGPPASAKFLGGVTPAERISSKNFDGSSVTIENLGKAPSRLCSRRRR